MQEEMLVIGFYPKICSYGEEEILPDVRCECYVLEDGQSVMSERCLSSK
ncbi:MAG: hypothetical protein HUU50_17015 [Candidatus Brocadiae bacterium]|nr:hypothetical protein [Candidatus Brocadiia bacterium]